VDWSHVRIVEGSQKLSPKRTTFDRCTITLSRWKNNWVSRSSPDRCEILCSRSLMNAVFLEKAIFIITIIRSIRLMFYSCFSPRQKTDNTIYVNLQTDGRTPFDCVTISTQYNFSTDTWHNEHSKTRIKQSFLEQRECWLNSTKLSSLVYMREMKAENKELCKVLISAVYTA